MTTVEAPAGFRFLQKIADDLKRRELTFPTFSQATLKVRAALGRPDIDVERLAQVISTEPLLAARLVRMANAAAFGSGGRPVGDVKSAVLRVGHAAVRSVATAVAMEQLKDDATHPPFRAIAESAWRHSVDVAAVAHVLAKRLSRINPDEALFAGLVHDIGHFYLLSQASHYPELENDPMEFAHILQEWHPSIGRALLHDFNLSDAVLEAVAEHENGRYRLPLRTLADIVTLANLSSAQTNPVVAYRVVPPGKLGEPEVVTTLVQAREEIVALATALRGC